MRFLRPLFQCGSPGAAAELTLAFARSRRKKRQRHSAGFSNEGSWRSETEFLPTSFCSLTTGSECTLGTDNNVQGRLGKPGRSVLLWLNPNWSGTSC